MQLESEFGDELDILWSPGGGIEYKLRSGLTESSPAMSILIYSMDPVRAAEYYVVRRDGSGAFLSWDVIEEEIETTGSQSGRNGD